jgi:hypothetical protein
VTTVIASGPLEASSLAVISPISRRDETYPVPFGTPFTATKEFVSKPLPFTVTWTRSTPR